MIKLENILKSIPNQEIIESERGQWEYPGRITRIPSNTITMGPGLRMSSTRRGYRTSQHRLF